MMMEEQMSAKQKRHSHVKNGLASCRLDDLWKSNCYAGSIRTSIVWLLCSPPEEGICIQESDLIVLFDSKREHYICGSCCSMNISWDRGHMVCLRRLECSKMELTDRGGEGWAR